MPESPNEPFPVAQQDNALDELLEMEQAIGVGDDVQGLLHCDIDEDDDFDAIGFGYNNEDDMVIEDPNLASDEAPFVFAGPEHVIDCGSHIPPDSPELDLVKEFRKYCEYAEQNTIGFTKEERFRLGLMGEVYAKGAPLEMVDTVLEMVYKREGILREGKSLRDVPFHMSRQRQFDKLATRYRMYPKVNLDEVKLLKESGQKNVQLPSYFVKKRVFLPHRRTYVDVFTHPFREQLVKLITDPRLLDTHWDFFDNDPLAPPPREWKTVGNCNTGLAYRATYNDLVKNPGKEIVLGIQIYMDSTATAQFSKLDYHAVRFSIANLTDDVSTWKPFVSKTHKMMLVLTILHVSKFWTFVGKTQRMGVANAGIHSWLDFKGGQSAEGPAPNWT